VPLFVGAAVNVTGVPEQMDAAVVLIDTETGTGGITVAVIAFDVTGEPVTHGKSDVMITLTTSPFVKLLVVKLDAFVPTFTPFTCH
jgi:hypothetical protein